jgi:predicted nucleic acid-binding Zn ribbon protein
MPIYNFECQNKLCEHQFEEMFYSFKEFEDKGPPRCPKCESITERIFCSINGEKLNVRFKGLPMGDGPSAGISNLRTRYPKAR